MFTRTKRTSLIRRRINCRSKKFYDIGPQSEEHEEEEEEQREQQPVVTFVYIWSGSRTGNP